MLLDLSKLIGAPGSALDFETSLDLSELDFGGCRPAKQPVTASGTVRNTAGVLLMRGEIRTRLFGVCDRCAREFERDVVFPLEAVLVTELASEQNEDDWVFVLENGCADLDDIVNTTFVLNMDTNVQARLQGPVLPVRRESQRRSLQLQTRSGSPLCRASAAIER